MCIISCIMISYLFLLFPHLDCVKNMERSFQERSFCVNCAVLKLKELKWKIETLAKMALKLNSLEKRVALEDSVYGSADLERAEKVIDFSLL